MLEYVNQILFKISVLCFEKDGNMPGKPSPGEDKNKPCPSNNNKPGGSRNTTKSEDKVEPVNGKKAKRNPKQDPFWYAKDQNAIANMASFPYLETVGEQFAEADSVPGIVVLHYNQTVGSDDPSFTQGTNYQTRAANAYFEYVTQGFTGGVPFEAPDLLMTALAAEGVYAKMISGKRIYGLLRYFEQFNSYYAKGIIQALGFDYEDWKTHMADFRAEYNIRVSQVNKQIAVPKSFFIGDRWEFLESYIFTDTEDPVYSTAFAFVCDKYVTYDATYLKTGTSLSWFTSLTDTGVNGITVEQFFSDLDHMIELLVDSDTRAMFGAIRRVYAPNDLKIVSELEDSYLTTILHHDIVDAQVHNCMWTDTDKTMGLAPRSLLTIPAATPENVALYQDEAGILHAYIGVPQSYGNPFDCLKGDQLLDMYDHMVNPANILDITADMAVPTIGNFTLEDSTGKAVGSAVCFQVRTEIITRVQTYYYAYATGELIGEYVPKIIYSTQVVSGMIQRFSHLDSHPLLIISSLSGSGTVTKQGYLGEIDKYTLIDFKKLGKLHNRCMYQLLSMPQNSKSVTK